MKQLFHILLILLPSIAIAQSWQPISTTALVNYEIKEPVDTSLMCYHIDSANREPLFTEPFRTLRIIDSTMLNNNSILYTFNNFTKLVDDSSVNPFETHFLGKQMHKTSAGVYHFYNPDTFTIQTAANLHDSWVFSTSSQDTATVSAVDTATVFGQQDSIKIITLQSGDSIILSKNYGIIFFGISPDQSFSLVGIEYSQTQHIGTAMPKLLDVFDHEIGDYFVYDYSYSSAYRMEEGKSKYTILNKTILPTGYEYTVRIADIFESRWIDLIDTVVSSEDSVVRFDYTDQDLYFNSVNGELTEANYLWCRVLRTSDNYLCKNCTKINPSANFDNNIPLNTVYHHDLGYTYAPTYLFVEQRVNGWGYGFRRSLIGGQQSGVIFGDTAAYTPVLSVNLLPETSIEMTFAPQPAINYLDIQLSVDKPSNTSGSIVVFDLNARPVIQQYIDDSMQQLSLDTSDLPSGIYYLQLRLGGLIRTQKISIIR